jgi:protein-L-isoaspartate(D-aspartate) O-methyltransferase
VRTVRSRGRLLVSLLVVTVAVAILVFSLVVSRPVEDSYSEARSRMVESHIRSRGVADPLVLRAMEAVPRHEFVLEEYLTMAYSDGPLPIGHGQTISQPYIVALMTELLQLQPGERVLEIGTGSGYQAAVLAEITDEVYSMEIIPELAESAHARLGALGYEGIHAIQADGYFGWEEHAPYDAIIVTAAPDHIPPSLVEQLKDGGRMVIPVGPVGWYQTLWLITKEGGEVEYHNKGGVQFVPLTGEH